MKSLIQRCAFVLSGLVLMVGCVNQPTLLVPPCDKPAPLDGEWNPRTPGYIAMYVSGVVDARSLTSDLARKHGFTPESVFGAVKGFSVRELSPEALAGLRCEPSVLGVSFNAPTWIAGNAL
jgi:hypothetical protein